MPLLTAIAPASLAVVALAWVDASVTPLLLDLGPERAVIIAIALASIVLAAIAAFVQDDIEHVLGYSIVGDAGVVVLALAALDAEAWAPARTWILAFVVARSAFAAWTAGIRAGFWTGRVADLRGWALRSPILGIAFVLIVVASVGFPGLAAFEARASIVDLTLDGPLATLVLLATLAPLAYYGRLLVIGLSRPDRVLEPVDAWRPRIVAPDLTGIRRWGAMTWDGNRAFSTAVVAGLLAALALGTSAGAFGVPDAAAGPPPAFAAPVGSAATASPAASARLPVPSASLAP
jgi:hydrogenase-4 component F